MSGQGSLINQLEGALATRGLSKRAEMLGQITDLFMHGSGNFSVDQIDLFDDVMSKLVEQIELTARAAFGSRLASPRTSSQRSSGQASRMCPRLNEASTR